MAKRNEEGQATLELALLLPLLMMFLLLIIQVGLVVEHQVLVVHAAREGARKAAVTASLKDIENDAASKAGLDKKRLSFSVDRPNAPGQTEKVSVVYRDPTDVPLVGSLLPSLDLKASVSMRVEQ